VVWNTARDMTRRVGGHATGADVSTRVYGGVMRERTSGRLE
jgi:hypothetical protein